MRAVEAVALCRHAPEAWDAVATAALELNDKRTSTIALGELFWSQGAGKEMTPSLALRRREQRLALESMGGGGGGVLLQALIDKNEPGGRAPTSRATRLPPPPPEEEEEEDPELAAAMRAIFSEGYVLPGEE